MAAEASSAPRVPVRSSIDPATPSFICTLHAAYERCWDAYNRAAKAQPTLEEDDRQHHSIELGLSDLTDQVDLLRALILYQLPNTDEDLTILAFHANEMRGWQRDDAEEKALATGTQAIFNYLVSESRADIELGEQFRLGAMLAFHAVQARTGELEEAA
jgi:hypothetical protein